MQLSASVDGNFACSDAPLSLQTFDQWKCRQQEAFGSTTAMGEAITWCVEKGREVALCDLTPLFSPPACSQHGLLIKEVCVEGGGGDQETDQGSHPKLSITCWGREARIP